MHNVRDWRTTVFIANTKYNKYIVKYILYTTKHIYNKKIHFKQYNLNNIYNNHTHFRNIKSQNTLQYKTYNAKNIIYLKYCIL